MAKTKSAAKQARAGERRRINNKSIKSRMHTLEGKFHDAVKTGKTEDANAALNVISSALDKAAKTQVIHRNTASRKKSRLAAELNKAAKKAA